MGISVALATYKRHETSLKLFHEFLLYRYQVEDLAVSEIDVEILQKYQHYLMTVRHNNNNTTVKYIRNLGKILNLAVSRKLITASPIEELKLKIEPVDKGFLTQEELTKLADKDFSIVRLEQVRDVFLFCCYTGLAYIDVYSLTTSDIAEENGRLWIRKARHKTSVMCHIPILKPAKEILDKYAWYKGSTVFPVPSNQKLNDFLKEAAKLAGLDRKIVQVYFRGNTRHEDTYEFWEQISCHDARRTFVCCSLALGIPASVVMSCTGHSDYESMKPYIEVADETQKIQMDKWNSHQYKSGIMEKMERMTSTQLKQLFEYVMRMA